jgi:cytochrome P450
MSDAVEELLRYLHVAHAGRARVARADITVGDQTIRAGEGVIMAGNVADRDPSAFVGDPDAVDLQRTARHHTAFGFGIHQCLGQPLARMELQVAYAALVRRIPTLYLAATRGDLDFKVDHFIYGVRSLPVGW